MMIALKNIIDRRLHRRKPAPRGRTDGDGLSDQPANQAWSRATP